jgi:hypothetical protein
MLALREILEKNRLIMENRKYRKEQGYGKRGKKESVILLERFESSG